MRSDQGDNLGLGPPPADFPHDPRRDVFPREWKDVAWRRLSHRTGLIVCPLCKGSFTSDDFAAIHMDHFWPRSLMGDTSWSNLRLLCSTCNVRRSNFIDFDIRRVLASNTFRVMVASFLREAVDKGNLTASPFLQELFDRFTSSEELGSFKCVAADAAQQAAAADRAPSGN